uniref:Putative secreted protein n=1 Tax=Xenopsylla cheopis TaxID=163159 RepID=A0A6M2DEK2_XENCH
MAIAYLNCRRVLSAFASVRYCSSMSNKKGLVLGIYDNEFDKKIRLTPTADQFNRRLQGRLLDLIHLLATN